MQLIHVFQLTNFNASLNSHLNSRVFLKTNVSFFNSKIYPKHYLLKSCKQRNIFLENFNRIWHEEYLLSLEEGGSRGVMVKAMDCGIVESEFVLQSRYYVHFRANTLGRGMNPLILPAMGIVLLDEWLRH